MIMSKEKAKYRKPRVLALFVCLAVACTAGLLSKFAVAKYYAIKEQEGISVASAFYFNSDKLAKPTAAGEANLEAVQNMSIEGLNITTNEDKWTGGTDCLFTVEVRNYDNKLLYNETNLTMEYQIYFRLVGTAAGATYAVKSTNAAQPMKRVGTNETAESLTLGTGSILECHGTLNGGSALGDRYEIRISPAGSNYDNDTCAKVLVFAYPTSPDYIANSASEEHRLIGVFQAVKSAANMTIESSYFDVEKKSSYQANWKTAVDDLSGLIYTIRTGGDALIGESNSVTQEAYVRWRPDYLEISAYDAVLKTKERKIAEARAKAEDAARQEGKTDAEITAAGDAAAAAAETAAGTQWDVASETIDGNTWSVLKLDVMPNTELNITFYKTDKFITEIGNGTLTRNAFQDLVKAYIP